MRPTALLLIPFFFAAVFSLGAEEVAETSEAAVFEERFPAFSPDGSRIAFVSDREAPGIFHLFVANADGTSLERLTSGDVTADWPSWSHDGMFLYFESRAEGTVQIFRIPSTGGDAIRVMESEEGGDSHAALSPKGDAVAFDSNREADGLRKVYTMAMDGSRLRIATLNPHSNSFPDWSPDGEFIAFRMRKSTFSPVSEIHVVKADGTGLRAVTKLGVACTQPDWSPDGTKIVFAAVLDGSHEICVANADGSEVIRITETKSHELRPTFSVDGTEILYCSNEEGPLAIYRMKADGTEPRRIVFTTDSKVPESETYP